jgi:hypothetical protein
MRSTGTKRLEVSDLERDFELDMDEPADGSQEWEAEEGDEAISEGEMEREFQKLAEESEPEEAQEQEGTVGDYAEKFYELSLRSYESVGAQQAVDSILNEMERDFFFKKLLKKAKSVGKGLLKTAGKGLLKRALQLAKNQPFFKAIQAATQLARGNTKGLLRNLANMGLSAVASAIPGGAVALPALKSLGLGFEVGEGQEENRERWRNFARVAKRSYEYLADNIDEAAVDDPAVAARLAGAAYEAGLRAVSRSTEGTPYNRVRTIQVPRGKSLVLRIESV